MRESDGLDEEEPGLVVPALASQAVPQVNQRRGQQIRSSVPLLAQGDQGRVKQPFRLGMVPELLGDRGARVAGDDEILHLAAGVSQVEFEEPARQ